MNGRGRMTLISKGLSTPNALLLDLIHRKMYWADSTLDNVFHLICHVCRGDFDWLFCW